MTRESGRGMGWLYGLLISVLGLAALAIPVYDVWDDATNLGWGIASTLVENSVLGLLAVGLIVAGVWVARRDWESAYLRTVVTWNYAVAVGVATLTAWVIGLQLWSMGTVKPYVLAADGVLFAAVTGFGVGVYNARSERAKDDLAEREAEYRTLTDDVLDTSDVATFVLDDSFEIVWINQATADYFGLDREAVVGRDKRAVIEESIADIFDRPDRFERLVTDTYADNSGTESFSCHVLPGPDREERWLEHWSQPISEGRYAGGRIEHYTDITERKRAFDDLAERERSLRRMYEVIADPGRDFEAKVDGVLDVGREMLDAEYGSFARIDSEAGDYHVEAVRSETVDIEAGDTIPYAQTHCQRMVQRDGTVTFAAKPFEDAPPEPPAFGAFEFDRALDDAAGEPTKDYGTDHDFEMYVGTPVAVDGELYGALCFLDDTSTEAFDEWERTLVELMGQWVGYELERKQLLEQRTRMLEESRERFASVVQNVDEYAIFTLDDDGVVTSWNDGAAEVFGYGADGIVGTHIRVLADAEKAAMNEALADAVEAGKMSGSTWNERADGSLFWAEYTITVRYDDRDELAGYTVIVRDMTDRQAYQRTIEHERERLEFTNRIVRHNILNGLNLLNARSEHLGTALPDEHPAQEHVGVIRDRVHDMSDLIDTMRTFMNAVLADADHPVGPVPLRAALEEKVALADDSYDATFRVHDLPAEGLRVEADELVGEVFENVLSNAVEHNDADEPRVEVWTSESTATVPMGTEGPHEPDPAAGGEAEFLTDAEHVADAGDGTGGGLPTMPGAAVDPEPRDVVTVHVADNGPGIPDEEKRSVLRKGESELGDPSHGFGLYLVREMMDSYGGAIDVRDNEPRGTVFDLTFPVSADAEDDVAGGESNAENAG